MRRLLPLLLILLSLWGCGSNAPNSGEIPQSSSPESVEPPPASVRLEQTAKGAVTVYPLNRQDCQAILTLGNDLLVFAGDSVTTLIKLSGSDPYITAKTTLDCLISADDPSIQANEKGITYYDPNTRELVFLDTTLKEVSRIPLPQQIQGSPALSADRKMLYYCTDSALQALDLETGFQKLLKEMSFPSQSVSRLHCDDSIIECRVTKADESITYFFSPETGETLWETTDELELATGDDAYFAAYSQGAYCELLVGTRDIGPYGLYFEDHHAVPMPLPDAGGLILLSSQENPSLLHYFDLESGLRTAQLELSGLALPRSIQASSDHAYIWMLGYDEDAGTDALYRWNPQASATGDEHIYIASRITADEPDTAGLEQCIEKAAEVSVKHGVNVQLWTEAAQENPADYLITAEYHVPVILESLEALDKALAVYPSNFLKQAAKRTSSGTLHISLVRSIQGTSSDSQKTAFGLQFWNEDGDAHIYLTVSETLTQNLHHELFHVVDTRVLSTTALFDDWNTLNPESFQYDYSYRLNRITGDSDLITGSDPAFIDTFSTTFPTEDRARIMEYAMMPGNEHYFASPILQEKLRQLCLGIRTAFKLKDTETPLLWEQYLAEPLT